MIDLMHARKVFDDYLKQFDRKDEKIKLKIVHTEGVIRCASEICRRMKLEKEDVQLAELIALLHDIGRFEQLRLYDSFEPTVMDHAAFGVQLLFGEKKMIRDFVQEDTWDQIIDTAIKKHSDYAVGAVANGRELLHACILRDADKLDNCRVKLEESVEVLLGCSPEAVGCQSISPQVWHECLNHCAIHSANRRTKMDYWVSYIAYFFDINYAETCNMILENDYVSRLVHRIPYSNRETAKMMERLEEMIIHELRLRTANATGNME